MWCVSVFRPKIQGIPKVAILSGRWHFRQLVGKVVLCFSDKPRCGCDPLISGCISPDNEDVNLPHLNLIRHVPCISPILDLFARKNHSCFQMFEMLYPLAIEQFAQWKTWLVVSTPLKNMKVSWDDYSQYMESHKIPWFQTTNQKTLFKLAKSSTKFAHRTPQPLEFPGDFRRVSPMFFLFSSGFFPCVSYFPVVFPMFFLFSSGFSHVFPIFQWFFPLFFPMKSRDPSNPGPSLAPPSGPQRRRQVSCEKSRTPSAT